MLGGRKKRSLRRVKPGKTSDRAVVMDGRDRNLLRPALILIFFALLVVLAGQFFVVIGYGEPLAPVRLVGYLLVVCLGVFATAGYLFTFERKVFEKRLRIFNFGLLCFCFAAIGRALLLPQVQAPQFLTPVSVLAILLVVLYSQRLAMVGALIVAFVVSLDPQPGSTVASLETVMPGASGFDFQLFVMNATGAMAGIFAARRMDTRTRLIKVGVFVGFGHAVGLLFSFLVLHGSVSAGWQFLQWGVENILRDLGWCLVSGVGAGFVLSGALPFVERIFRLTTDIRLKELSDLNQPILRRFLIEAPGSYHHSLIVGTLCEAAAQHIGANSILARVGAYFHDIGKLNKPDYFTENEAIKGSKHATLSPTMSTLIIIAHVKDGVEIAEDLNLPNEVVSIIREHHGTGLIEYFYREALEEQRRESGEHVEDQLFRYPGPKPSSREAAIVHLADAVEAVSRTLEEPSPSRIEEVVSEVVRRRLNDGQLDESGLTLTDISRIEETFTRVLMGIFHTRIKYQKEPVVK